MADYFSLTFRHDLANRFYHVFYFHVIKYHDLESEMTPTKIITLVLIGLILAAILPYGCVLNSHMINKFDAYLDGKVQ